MGLYQKYISWLDRQYPNGQYPLQNYKYLLLAHKTHGLTQ